jgi:hypothetical protein
MEEKSNLDSIKRIVGLKDIKKTLSLEDLRNMLSLSAFKKYIEIKKKINKPIITILVIFENGDFGKAMNIDDKYLVFISEDIKAQKNVDTNFLHECLHLLQFEKGIPSVKPINKSDQDRADNLITTFLDVQVEKKIKSWEFDNSYFINLRLENIKKHYNSYMQNQHLQSNTLSFDCGLVLSCALMLSICKNDDICKLKSNIKNDKITIFLAKKISKIIKKTDFRQYEDIKNKINEVMEILNITKMFIVVTPNNMKKN